MYGLYDNMPEQSRTPQNAGIPAWLSTVRTMPTSARVPAWLLARGAGRAYGRDRRSGVGDYFARLNPCIPESTQVPPAVLHEGGGYLYGLGQQVNGMYGLGSCDCNGTCGSCGMGLFDSGFDWTNWGWQEWASAAGIAFVAFSVLTTGQRGARSVRRRFRRRRVEA